MRKIIFTLLLVLTLGLVGCSKTSNTPTPTQKIDINIASLKGPTTMGLVKMKSDSENKTASNNYNFEIFTTADEIVTKLAQKQVDIASIPANLASTLYKKMQGNLKVIDINTLGVLYVVENGNSINSLADLKGKTVYMTSKGTVPEYSFRYLLSKNGLSASDVTLEFKSEATEVVSLMQSGENIIAVLPEPFVTVAKTQNNKIRTCIDLTKEWDKIGSGSFVTGVTVVRGDFLESHPDAVTAFLDDHKKSAEYTNKNIEQAATLIEQNDIVKAPIAKLAIPNSNITCITGNDMKTKLSGYLKALFEQNPQSVGGSLPDEAFYFTK